MSDAGEPTGLDTSPVATQRRLKDILVSTLVVGGGSVVTIICGVVRSKVISLTVGPAGIGLQGLLQSTMKTTSTIAGLGLSTSGVREVARLRGENKPAELGHTLRAIRFATLLLGALAGLVLLVFQRPLAAALLDDASLGWSVAIAGLGVFAQVMYCTYDAYLRGFRRVKLLTKAAVAANALAAGTGAVLVFALGSDGIVWAVIAQPVLVLIVATYVGRDMPQHLVAADRIETRKAFSRVIQMGVVLAATGFITTGVQLAARVLVARSASLEEVGYFQAAWAVSILYLGFVLGAMSLDYYPRLAEIGSDRKALTQMVNEQSRVSFFLAGPAMLGLLTLSTQVIVLLYSSKFSPAIEILRWQLLGDVLKIGSWKLAYLVLAQGKPRVYFLTELSWNVTYIGVLAALLPSMGINAAAAAYVAASIVYFVLLTIVTNRLTGFSWARANVKMMVALAALAGLTLAAQLLLTGWWDLVVGGAITIGFGVFCLWRLLHEAGFMARFRRKPQ